MSQCVVYLLQVVQIHHEQGQARVALRNQLRDCQIEGGTVAHLGQRVGIGLMLIKQRMVGGVQRALEQYDVEKDHQDIDAQRQRAGVEGQGIFL